MDGHRTCGDSIGIVLVVQSGCKRIKLHIKFIAYKNALFVFLDPFFKALPNPVYVFGGNLKLKAQVDEFHEVDKVIVVAHFMESSAQERGRNIHGP